MKIVIHPYQDTGFGTCEYWTTRKRRCFMESAGSVVYESTDPPPYGKRVIRLCRRHARSYFKVLKEGGTFHITRKYGEIIDGIS